MKTTLRINNLKCGGCANTIVSRLSELDPISEVTVDNDEHTVTFEYTDMDSLVAAAELLANLGYPVDGYSNTLSRRAKSYLSCAIGRFGG